MPCYSPSFLQLNIRLMFNFKWPYFKDHPPCLSTKEYICSSRSSGSIRWTLSRSLHFIPSFLNHQNWMDCVLWPNTMPTIWQIHALCVFMCVYKHSYMEWRVNTLKKCHRIIFSYVNATPSSWFTHTFCQAFKCRIVNKTSRLLFFSLLHTFIVPLPALENIWRTRLCMNVYWMW